MDKMCRLALLWSFYILVLPCVSLVFFKKEQVYIEEIFKLIFQNFRRILMEMLTYIFNYL